MQSAQSEPANEIEIAVEKVVVGQSGRVFPFDLLEGDALRLAYIALNGVEQQQQRTTAPGGLLVARNLPADHSIYGEFFAELAR